MKIDSTEFRKYLSKEIDKANIEPINDKSGLYIFLCIVLFFIGFIIIAIHTYLLNKKKKEAIQALNQVIPNVDQLYAKYFELSVKNADYLTFDQIVKNTLIDKGDGLKFEYYNQEFLWNVYEWTELKPVQVWDPQTKSYRTEYKTVWFMKTAMQTYIPKLHDYDHLTFANNSSFLLKKLFKMNRKGYQTESIDFNKRFSVIGENELQIAKLFRPVVIDNFVKDSNYRLPDKIVLDHGQINENWQSGESNFPWNAKIVRTLNDFDITGNIVDNITNKIENDFSKPIAYVQLLDKLKIN